MSTLTVAQGSAPTLKLVLRVKDENGEYVVRDLTSVSGARFIIKASPDAADPSPSYSYPDSIAMPDPRTSGVILVTFQASDTASPGNKFYRIDLAIGSVWVLAGHGRLHVADV